MRRVLCEVYQMLKINSYHFHRNKDNHLKKMTQHQHFLEFLRKKLKNGLTFPVDRGYDPYVRLFMLRMNRGLDPLFKGSNPLK